jgi:hypothetical protein
MNSSNAEAERKLRMLGKRLRLGLMHQHDVPIPRIWVVEEVSADTSAKIAERINPAARRKNVSKSGTRKRVLSKPVSKRQVKRRQSKSKTVKKQSTS